MIAINMLSFGQAQWNKYALIICEKVFRLEIFFHSFVETNFS